MSLNSLYTPHKEIKVPYMYSECHSLSLSGLRDGVAACQCFSDDHDQLLRYDSEYDSAVL